MDMIAERFRAAASLNPQAIAIDDGTQQFTYLELTRIIEACETRLGLLTAAIEGPASRTVAIFAKHSAEAAAISFATVLAGWAYTPVDPGLTDDAALRDLALSGASIVLANRDDIERTQTLARDNQLILSIEDVFAADVGTAPFAHSTARASDAPAYRLCTSGTNRAPRAISHTRASLVRAVDCYGEDSGLCSEDRVSLVMPLGFTPSVFCLFGALLTGARLCVFDVKSHSIGHFRNWVHAQKLSLLYMTPTLFRRWANGLPDNGTPDATAQADLRMIQLAGEPVLASDVALFQRKFPRTVKLYNGMGTTETSCAARFVIDHSMIFADGCVPIGQAYGDVDLIIRNPDGRMLGAGEIGALSIKTDWQPDSVEFETGDLAMLEEGGRVIHCGRRGDRTRIDGVTVDLLELESLLMKRPDILEAVVMTSPEHDRLELVACVAFLGAAETRIEDVQDWLTDRVPSQMVPKRWLVLERLPTSMSGKVARRELRQLLPQATYCNIANKAEPDRLGADVLDMVRAAIGQPNLPANADIFASGADLKSCLALTMAIEQEFGIGLSVSRLKQAPTAINLVHDLRRQLAVTQGTRSSEYDLAALWRLDHSPKLETKQIEITELPDVPRRLLVHGNSMTAMLEAETGGEVALHVLAQRQAGRYFMRKIELIAATGQQLAIAGIRVDLAAFESTVQLEIIAGDTPFGTILRNNGVAARHKLQSIFEVDCSTSRTYGRTNLIRDASGRGLADVIEVLLSDIGSAHLFGQSAMRRKYGGR